MVYPSSATDSLQSVAILALLCDAKFKQAYHMTVKMQTFKIC